MSNTTSTGTAAPRITHRHVLAKLATSPIYERDENYWSALKVYLERIRAHYAELGLDVVLDEHGGYAYLRQHPDDTGDTWAENHLVPLPTVLRRRSLSYYQTLFLVLLRESLLRHDQIVDSDPVHYLKEEEIHDMLRPYYRDTNNEKIFRSKVSALLQRFDELNLLTPLKNRTDPIYRVEQIIKARLPPEQIADIRTRLLAKDAGTAPTADGTDAADANADSSSE